VFITDYFIATQQQYSSNNKKFSSQFSVLLVTVVQFLDTVCSDKLEACKEFCSSLKISDNSTQLLFNDEQLKIINDCKTFKELFFSTHLRQHWGWSEYTLLERIIHLSGSQYAEDELKKYNEFMACNIGMNIVSERYSIQNLPANCVKLHLVLNKTYTKFTAEDYKEVKEFIHKTLDIKEYITYPFIIFLFGSLHLEIYAPKQATEYMIKMAKMKEKVLKENRFIFVQVAGEVVMNASQEQVVDIDKIPHTKVGQIVAATEFEITDLPGWVSKGNEIQIQVVSSKIPYKAANLITIQVQLRAGDVITVPVKDNQDGSYTASFLANQTGEVKLSITINGQHIKGSPYSLQVRQYSSMDKLNKIVDDGGRMGEPWGIAFRKDGVWAVADCSNHCVCIFDSQNQLVKRFGSHGNGNGQFSSPRGLAFDANNHLYVVDRYNHRVQKFDINGRYLLQFGKFGSDDGELSGPVGITVYADRVFVADRHNGPTISVFQCDGRFSYKFRQGQLNNPLDVAVTNNNQVLVADGNNDCISIFTLDGNYIGKIGTRGSEEGQLRNPSSVTVDLNGFIMVTECDNNRVSIFDKDGIFVYCFGSYGSSAGQFSSPLWIACSPNGSVYVSDRNNKRIQIFSDY